MNCIIVGFIQPGDWILNVEGEDLIGIPVKKAKEFISIAMSRWSVSIPLQYYFLSVVVSCGVIQFLPY